MHGFFSPLTDDEKAAAAQTAPTTSSKAPIVPVPDDAPPMEFRHPKHGEPSRVWRWEDADGRLSFYTARFDFTRDNGEPGKDVLPIAFCDLGDGRRGWRAKAPPDPRPLYRLTDIERRTSAPVIVCEGEKAADAAVILFPDFVVTTPMGGSKAPRKTDWSPLATRHVVVWPDNDKPGADFAEAVAKLATEAGATSVATVEVPNGWPEGWDLADEPLDGVTVEDLRVMIDRAAPFGQSDDASEKHEWPFRITKSGVEKRIERIDKETGGTTVEWKWFCSVLKVDAETRNADGEEWGRQLTVIDRDGKSKSWAMPMSMLAGDGTSYRERLLSLGLILAPGASARNALHEYVSTANPDQKARCVNRIGWHTKNFVLFDTTIGAHDDE